MKKKLTPIRAAAYVLGLLILAIGGSVSMRSDLGSSPVASVPFCMNFISGLEVGLATTAWQTVLVLIQLAILRKKFSPWAFLQLIPGFLFGYCNTIAVWLVSFVPAPNGIVLRLVFTCLGFILCALGVWLYSTADILNMPSDALVVVISDKTGKPFHSIKRYFDICSVVIAGALCLLFTPSLTENGVGALLKSVLLGSGAIGSVGLGTVIISIMTGTMIGVYERFFGTYLKRFLKVG